MFACLVPRQATFVPVKDVGLGDGSRGPVSIEAGAAGWL
jgi:hypothetical protein